MAQTIRSIGVIGGGSAGYISALYLKKTFPEFDVTVVESSKIPVVGVGEATTQPMLRFLHETMGFPVREFFQEARPTLKLGVQFIWGDPRRHHFNNPFGTSSRADALRHTGDPNNLSLLSMLMERDRTPFFRRGETVMASQISTVAYHIDNRHFLRYLRGKLPTVGCRHLDATVADVRLKPGGHEVDQLQLDSGETCRFDLYLDCSGFRSLLLGAALAEPWVSYADSLRTDRAVVGTRPTSGDLPSYTTAATLRHGWLWNTPMQDEEHLGYVFSSRHCSDDEAMAELEEQGVRVQNGRVVRFRSGRHRASWVGNVVALGNAYAFIEPLESTSIHMLLQQLRTLLSRLRQGADQAGRETYNQRTAHRWDSLRWFVALHFRFNGKLETPFWRECREEADVSGLQDFIDYFEREGPISGNPEHPLYRTLDEDATFPVFAYDAVMAGCGIHEDAWRGVPPAPGYPAALALNRSLVGSALGHREALRHLCDHDVLYRRPSSMRYTNSSLVQNIGQST